MFSKLLISSKMQAQQTRLLNSLVEQFYVNVSNFIELPITMTSNSKRRYSKGAKKQKLLKMPAIKLEETIPKFLNTVKPLLTTNEYNETERITKEFQCGEGAELQKLLEQVAEREENWLAHRWLKHAYLGYRAPVVLYSSPCMPFPFTEFKNYDEYIMYSAKLIMGLVKFKKRVDDGLMPIVKMGKLELDNSQFGIVYGTCRIPLPEYDELQFNPNSKHVVVLYRNHFFKLPVYNKTGCILNAKILAEQLKNITESVKTTGKAIGILTTNDRDSWAEAYEELSKCIVNCKSVKIIQSALFTVNLDQCVEFSDNKHTDAAQQLMHGGGSKQNSGNRWMDKTIQVIINPNGISGFSYEHSPAEGQPIALMTEYLAQMLPKQSEFEDGASDNYEPASKIQFGGPLNFLEDRIKSASENIDKLCKDNDQNVLHYKCYGKEFIKKNKLGPDSYIQMALQYAYYKVHKVPTAQYESAHLRVYYGGRTETIRSCSNESLAFAKAMMDPAVNANRRVELIRAAVSGHQQYTRMALLGKGVDRHLFGLKLMAVENNRPIPKFFSTPGFVKSSTFRVSTSQVATKNTAVMSYGPPLQDGYACCYNPRDDDMFLSCASWHSAKETSTTKFAEALKEALDEMHDALIAADTKDTDKKKK